LCVRPTLRGTDALLSGVSSYDWGATLGGKQLPLVDRTSPTATAGTVTSVDGEEATDGLRLAGTRRRRWSASQHARFWLGMVSAVGLGAVFRFTYLYHGAPTWVLGDGFWYYVRALRLADGLGYTSAPGVEYAHHPPAWVTLLAGVSELGWRSMRSYQVTGLVIGLAVILVAGLVGRRYAGHRAGVLAAFLAAVYPGFWVIDVQILSEPLGLLVLGVLMLALAGLWERPTLARAILSGAAVGALALVRGEQLALLVVAVAPILLLNPRVGTWKRLAWTAASGLAAVVLVVPWTIHNLSRFEEPVVLSTNGGSTLLAGNCPPRTYGGELVGSFDVTCNRQRARRNLDLDASQADVQASHIALDNMRDNLERLPATILARYARTMGVFRPAQTVGIDANWFGSATWPVWAWVTSFWVLAPLAAYGSVLLGRSRRFQWPLVAPAVIVLIVVTVAFGDPRYHTMADLGIVVLAAVALNELTRRPTRSRPA
jgi:4-amino-4-deoxy-L-arabinose transferase-like glycosyltransferase